MPVTRERSAGVLVYRIPRRNAEPEFLLLDYGKYWDYAKGHVEKGEDDLTAAVRELREETGLTEIDLHDGFRHELSYFFRDKRKGLINKTVVFFLARAEATAKAKISHEHVGAGFFPYAEAMERVTFKNAKEALKAAKDHLDAVGATH